LLDFRRQYSDCAGVPGERQQEISMTAQATTDPHGVYRKITAAR
jgi:hypothetical protein